MRNGRETWKGVKMSLIRGIHHVCLKCANEEEYKEVVHFLPRDFRIRDCQNMERRHYVPVW